MNYCNNFRIEAFCESWLMIIHKIRIFSVIFVRAFSMCVGEWMDSHCVWNFHLIPLNSFNDLPPPVSHIERIKALTKRRQHWIVIFVQFQWIPSPFYSRPVQPIRPLAILIHLHSFQSFTHWTDLSHNVFNGHEIHRNVFSHFP